MASQKPPVVIQGGRLIDGNGGKPVDNATVVIEGNRIKQVAAGMNEWVADSEAARILAGRLRNDHA